jgi:hypothetical protein
VVDSKNELWLSCTRFFFISSIFSKRNRKDNFLVPVWGFKLSLCFSICLNKACVESLPQVYWRWNYHTGKTWKKSRNCLWNIGCQIIDVRQRPQDCKALGSNICLWSWSVIQCTLKMNSLDRRMKKLLPNTIGCTQ